MKLTGEQLIAGARSVAQEQMGADPYLANNGRLVITPPSIRGGWRAERAGTTCDLDESMVIIRALVLMALGEDGETT